MSDDIVRSYFVATFCTLADDYVSESIAMSLDECKRFLFTRRKTHPDKKYVILAVLNL